MNIVRRSRPGREIPSGPVCFLSFSHRLVNDEADGVRRHPAHPLGGMGVGVQGEPGGAFGWETFQGITSCVFSSLGIEEASVLENDVIHR